MRKITLTHRLEYAVLITVVFLLRAMPLWMASGLMGWCWRMVAPRLSRQKRAMDHLRLCFPNKSEDELYRLTLGMWDNLGRTFAESLLAEKFMLAAHDLVEMPEDITDLVERMHEVGGVIVSLHSGNWELGGVLSAAYGFNCAVIIQKLKNPLVHDFMVSQRGSTFRGGIFAKGDRAGMRIMNTLKGGILAAVMGDLRDGRGVTIPFFGMPAKTNQFAALLARQQNVPLVAVRILRTDGIHFKLELTEIDVPRTDDADGDILKGTMRMTAQFEDWIRAHPEQWMWAHKRWS
ncbi:lysophospholipid acyltransferase family protein [Cohaesibacter sp. ES.047]|uniref:lysophospholipid acyltransferase family protein n=1 Tax=Cohaesibacter sp. ES.047 TaxID=1798205 RepID=UPI0012FD81B6|nr:lauroyl acyltransferase [Cohaesibacter sp. ES.047]